MGFSYQGIGEWCATFACSGLSEGALVKMSGGGTVAACAAGDAFCGVVLAASHDGKACSVQLGGLACVPYSGTAPAVGYAALSADGAGGVKADEGGASWLVIDADSAAKTVTIKL